MMPTVSRTLQRTAFLLVLCILLGSFSGCFGRGKDPQEETSDSTGNTYYWDDIIETVPEETATESTDPTEESTEPTEESTEPTEETEPEGLAGVITGDLLNVRSGPGTNYNICGSLKKNDRVLILEQKIVDDKLWGRTEEGWISMNYVLLEDPDQVLTVKETLKGIALEKLKLHEGPGSQYTSSGSLAKNSRVTILETCGAWGKTEKGWISLEDVYIDGTEGPEDPVKGTVTGSEVNLRADPSTGSTIKGTVKKNDRVEILFQVKIGNMTWGCTKKGWISMDYVRLDEDAKEDIVGSWYCYWDITETSKTISYYSRTYTFKADGTYTFASYIIDINSSTGAGSYEIYASGSGSYAFDGSTLTLGNRGYSAEVKGDELYLTEGSDAMVYVPGDLEDSFEYAKNQHKQDANDPAIVGSWYYQTEVTSDISIGNIYEFHADGTFNCYGFRVGWDGIGYIQTTDSGTYTYADNTLVWKYGSHTAEVKNGKLHLTMSNDTYVCTPGGLEEAVEDARGWYDITEPTEPEPTETEPPVLNSSIFGTWQEITRCTYCTEGQCITYHSYWVFNSDGTFECDYQDRHYFYTPEGGAVRDTGGLGTGSQRKSGTYTFDGSTLVLTFTYIEYVDLDSSEISTWQVTISNGHLVMSGSYTRNFYKGTLDEAAALLFS